jgi:hypothetical protein
MISSRRSSVRLHHGSAYTRAGIFLGIPRARLKSPLKRSQRDTLNSIGSIARDVRQTAHVSTENSHLPYVEEHAYRPPEDFIEGVLREPSGAPSP